MLAWAAAWATYLLLAQSGLGAAACFGGGLAVSLLLASCCQGRWRQMITAAGFPLSAAALGGASGLPSWAWLLLLLPLLAAYPLRAWRDAPFFPTPPQALSGLSSVVTPAPVSVLDAGCGLGHGMAALRALWPQARVHGVESSVPLAWLAARRCRDARVVRGDMWAADWSGHDLVYAFQRPDNMARIWAKAVHELAPGAWLVSLEFAVPGGVAAHARLVCADGRHVWIYQTPSCPPSPMTAGSTTGGPGR
ncbi:MAG TPA: methyltransferase domain-containing protein [Rubrivivax sp.]|nr:methyltransferase domain-containing protein [Rubrivivax sp.]